MTRIDPGVVLLVAELRGHERQAAEELERVTRVEAAQAPRRIAGGDHARPAADRRGVGLVGEGLETEKSRGADDLVDQMSQALNRCAPR